MILTETEARKSEELKTNEEDWGELIDPTDVSETVFKDSEIPFGGGEFGDVYKGRWVVRLTPSIPYNKFNKFNNISHLVNLPVAIKTVRPLIADGPDRDDVKRVSRYSLDV